MRRNAYILAGGKSSRFGVNKARVLIAGTPQIARIATALKGDHWDVTAIAQQADEFADLGIRTLPDIAPDQGPLAGILSGLIDLGKQRSHYGLFVTCDLWQWHPLWTEVFLKETSSSTDEPLLYSFDLETSDKVSFVPFPCWLHRDCLAILSEDWQIGSRSIRRAFELLSARHNRMPIPREYLPRSFNTPEELERLQDEQRD